MAHARGLAGGRVKDVAYVGVAAGAACLILVIT